MSKIVFCKGIEEPAAAGEGIKNLRADYFDYAMIPLRDSSLERMTYSDIDNNTASSNTLVLSNYLNSSQWACVFGQMCEKYGRSEDKVAGVHETIFQWDDDMQEQFDWALHLGVNCIVLPQLTSFVAINYAQCALHLASLLLSGFHAQQLLVPVPFTMSLHHSTQSLSGASTIANASMGGWSDSDDSLLMWNNFKLLTGHHCRLHGLLDLSIDDIIDCFWNDKEEAEADENRCFQLACRRLKAYTERWAAEQLRGVVISTHLFHPNDAGFPVLPKEYQLVVAVLLRYCSLVCFKGPPTIPGSFTPYLQYINHIQSTGEDIIKQCCGEPESVGAKCVSTSILPFSSEVATESDRKKIRLMNRDESSTSYPPTVTADVHVSTAIAQSETEVAEREAFSDHFTAGYKDTLQMPLQPLADNLQNSTYETFERDPTKYQKYEEAVAKGLVCMAKRRGGGVTIHVAVVGAGRGPLVACVLRASVAVGVTVSVFAVEKNKNAIVTLCSRKSSGEKGWEHVTIVKCDMRVWVPSTGLNSVDILVSELLGSWGDNELSPECLDHCIARCLRIEHQKSVAVSSGTSSSDCHDSGLLSYDGICIPTSYTSFLTPLSTSKLWMSARDVVVPGDAKDSTGLNTPFVVKLHHFHFLSTEPQSVFCFQHPPPKVPLVVSETDIHVNSSNRRYNSLSFVIAPECGNMTLHGFAGTFESELFEGVMLSIKPDTHTAGMFSWFPLYLPLATPILVRAGDKVTVHLWRCVDEHKVWYEWCLSSPSVSPVQNSNGKSYAIRLR